jgi:hypothetical protein
MVKLFFSLGLINQKPNCKDAWGSEGISPSFLLSTLDVGE